MATALADELGLSQPATSQHLKVLRESGLVTVRAVGTSRLYRIDRDRLAEASVWFDQFGDPWQQPLDALETELVRGRPASAVSGRWRTGADAELLGTTERPARRQVAAGNSRTEIDRRRLPQPLPQHRPGAGEPGCRSSSVTRDSGTQRSSADSSCGTRTTDSTRAASTVT